MTRPETNPTRLTDRIINLLDAGRLGEARDLLVALPGMVAALVEEAMAVAHEDGVCAAGRVDVKAAHAQHWTLQ